MQRVTFSEWDYREIAGSIRGSPPPPNAGKGTEAPVYSACSPQGAQPQPAVPEGAEHGFGERCTRALKGACYDLLHARQAAASAGAVDDEGALRISRLLLFALSRDGRAPYILFAVVAVLFACALVSTVAKGVDTAPPRFVPVWQYR